MRKIKAICFDFDGTLVDSEPLHYASWKEELQQFGCEFPMKTYLDECSGVSTVKVAQKLISEYQLPIDAQTLANQKTTRFVARLEHELPTPVEGSANLLAYVKQSPLKVALVTGSYRVEIERILNGLGWSDYFELIITRDEVEQPKPHTEPYLKALSLLDLQPEEAFALEDSRTGMQSAWNAGLKVCAIQTRHHTLSDEQMFHHAFYSLAEFEAHVRNYLAETCQQS